MYSPRASQQFRIAAIAFAVMTAAALSDSRTAISAARAADPILFAGARQALVMRSGAWSVLADGRITIHDPAGQPLRTLNMNGRELLVGEQGGDRVGVVVYDAMESPTNLRATSFETYDATGVKTLSLINPDFATAFLPPKGNGFVGLMGAEGLKQSQLRFYDDQGNRTDSLTVEFFEGGQYSRDGEIFLFRTAGEGVQAMSRLGQRLWTVGPAAVWAASPNGRTVAIARQGMIRVFQSGLETWSRPWGSGLGIIRQLSVRDDGSALGAVSSQLASVLHRDTSQATIKRSAEAGWNYRSIDLSPNGNIALGMDFDPDPGSPQRHRQSRCLILGPSGSLLNESQGAPAEWGAMFPRVQFDGSGSRLLFLDRDQARWLDIE